MKKRNIFLITMLLSLFLSLQAYAATIVYDPVQTSVTLQPGTGVAVPLTVSLTDFVRGSYYLRFLDSVENGNLPKAWISASPSMAFLDRWNLTASTVVTVSVPQGTPPGAYSADIYSWAMASHEIANRGNGMLLEVVVPSLCSAAPEFEITSFGPEYIWPPNHSMETVSVAGRVTLPEGCSLLRIGYNIDDEYGIYTSTGEFTISEDGSFVLYLPVEAWRNGNDKDGRHYSISLFAEDEAGTQSLGDLQAIVPHDQRNK